jgi:hypothetical protein
VRFEYFLMNEGKVNLAQNMGDILTAIQGLSDDASGLSRRAMDRGINQVVDQIRRTLHGHWEDTERPFLLTLQKIGVALMNVLSETDGDIPSVLISSVSELERALSKIEEPINTVGAEKDVDEKPDDEVDSGSGLPDEIGSGD